MARSLIHALNILGVAEIRVVAPRTLLPAAVEGLGVRVFLDPVSYTHLDVYKRQVHLHLIPRHVGDQPDPRGARWIFPGKARDWP